MADPSIQECVEAYLFVAQPRKILLFRRPPQRDRIWVPISGKVEATDRSFRAAMDRELLEETGIRAPADVIDLEHTVDFPGPDGRTWRLHAFAVELPDEWEPHLGPEHEAFAWVDPDEAVRRLHYLDNRDAVRTLLRRLESPARIV